MATHSICILGGSGFVGTHLTARLAEDKPRIRILPRHRERHRELLVLPTVTLVRADVHDLATLQREFADCDTVINLVGILNEKGRDGRGFRQVHVELTRKVLEACRTDGIERLLHMSGLKADAAKGPSLYLRSKGEAEALIRQAGATGLKWTIFQPSVIFGSGDSFIHRFARLLQLMPGLFPLARPNARFAPVFVGDVVEAFARALANRDAHSKTFQLCGPKVYSLREIVEYIATTLACRRRVVGLPDPLSRLQARLMELVPGTPFSMDNYLSLTLNSICEDNSLARLGITPTSLESVVPRQLTGVARPAHRFSEFRRSAGR